MSKIKLLSDELIGKIAAGEVVERPASVVKELVENSIDAGAREIVIDIEEGGKKRIIVMDDGCGMSADDARLAVQRHATSKISTDADLDSINTMGFRGEALPSIAAVSKLVIETRSSALSGFKLVISGGKTVESGEFGCADGTRIVIEDLFLNTPARKKFLRGDKTEEGHVIDTVSRLALAFPEVRFKLSCDGKEKLSCLSAKDPRTRLFEVFGKALAENARSFEENGSGIKISGFLGSPDAAKSVAQGVYLFVNRRYIKDRSINHAVVDGYRGLLPNGSYPFAIVMLDVDPSRVDVNVHPTKQEVRFDNIGAVHNFVASAVRKSVQRRSDHSEAFGLANPDHSFHRTVSPVMNFSHQDLNKSRVQEDLDFNDRRPLAADVERAGSALASMPHSTGFFSSLRVVGQLANSFVICEDQGGHMVVVDQHAAHERIGFEKLKKQLSDRRIEQQQLLIPVQVDLLPKESACITEHLEKFNLLGLEIEPFGGKTFMVKAVPSLLTDTDIRTLVLKLARELADIGGSASVEEVTDHILKTMACHRQVRANHYLKHEEMQSLLRQMDEWPNTGLCPHGRPSYKRFPFEDVKKWFNRT